MIDLKRFAVWFLLVIIGLTGNLAEAQKDTTVFPRNSSDWWSVLGSTEEIDSGVIQHRELSGANYQILGIDVRDFSFAEVEKRLGNVSTVGRGDASTSREQACYMSPLAEHPTYLIFEQGEVALSFYLFSVTTPWDERNLCASSKQVTRGMKTNSGLRLGLTMNQVIGILGKPSKRLENELDYFVTVKMKESSEALARARSQHPELSDKEFHEDYDEYDLTVFIRAQFDRSGMIYLAVVTTETN